jgi:hypothetical protein
MATQVTLNSGSVDSAGSLALKTNGTTTAVTINASQGVEFNAGAVGTPSITTTGDTNTGIFFPAADTIAFAEGGAEAMRIDSSGNVGIGTSSPTAKLDILGGIRLNKNGDLSTAKVGNFGSTNFEGYIEPYSSSGWTDIHNTVSTTGVRFFTGNSDAERMRIDSSGNLLVGKTAANLGTNGLTFQAGGEIFATIDNSTNTLHVYSSTASAYRFYVSGTGTVFATNTTISAISDQRLKENVQDLDVGLDKIMALKPRKFDWKEGKGKNVKGDRGWIAQEFESVFPDMIDEWKDPSPDGEEAYKSVRADLIPVLVKAIQEQQALITTLTDRITALEAK